MRSSPLAPSGLSVFVIVSRCGSDGQLLQPCGQPFELLVCAEFVQPVNTDLNRLSVVVGDAVDVFGAAHDRLQSRSWPPQECSVIGLVPPDLAARASKLAWLPHAMCELLHTCQRAGVYMPTRGAGRRYDSRCCESAPQPNVYFHVSVKWLTRLYRFPLSNAPHRPRARRQNMSRRFRTSLGIILVAVVIAAATTWAASLIAQSDSTGPTQAREVIYRPQHLLLY